MIANQNAQSSFKSNIGIFSVRCSTKRTIDPGQLREHLNEDSQKPPLACALGCNDL